MGDALDKLLRLSELPGARDFPGRDRVKLPPTPPDAKAMMTAHRVDDALSQVSHAMERVTALKKAKGADQRRYHSIHLANHMSRALDEMHGLDANLRANYPAEAAELEAVKQVMGLAKAVCTAAKAATTAHLTETSLHELAHAKRHADLMMKPDPAAVWEFNFDHAAKHVGGAHDHIARLAQHLTDNYPAEGKWLAQLRQDTTVRASAPLTSEQANYRTSDVPGQTCHTCANRNGSRCDLVQVTVSRTGVCDSYEGSAQLAAPAAWPSGKPYARSFLSPPKDPVVSAPGAGVLRQEPSQTVSPSPPLPPSAALPSPKELRSFGTQLSKMRDDDENHHLTAAVMHLESAAEKMPNNPVSALASMRSAQMAIQNEWRERIACSRPRIAYAFSVNTPPAEQAGQQKEWARAQAAIGQMQGAASRIAQLIDRVRRNYFHKAGMLNETAGGGLAGQPNARM